MATPVAQLVRLAPILGVLVMLACSGESDRDPAPPATPVEMGSAAGATVTDDAGGTSDASRGGSAGDVSPAGSPNAGQSSGESGGVASTGGTGDVTNAPGAGLDCSSTQGSAPCAAGLLATRPCSSGPRASACVCMSPCHGAADCGGASCVEIALISGAKGSVCPPPSYTCAVP